MKQQPLILCTDVECRFTDADMHRLREAGKVEISPSYAIGVLMERISAADVLVTSCFAGVPAELIEAGRRLKGIVKYGVGVDNIDLEAAARHGVPVANCPDYGSGAIADHAFALLIALARKLTILDSTFRAGGWFWPDDRFIGANLEGKTLGIIGLGRTGRKMARRAAGFEMRLAVYDPYVDDAQFNHVPLATLLAESDFVSIHCILTPETRGMIGESQLRAMKPSAYLIDVSRGAIIREAALLRALEEGWIAGAGLDVFGEEPIGRDHPLLSMTNTVVTPHLAWYTREAAARQSGQAADAVLDLLAGRGPRSLVVG